MSFMFLIMVKKVNDRLRKFISDFMKALSMAVPKSLYIYILIRNPNFNQVGTDLNTYY